MNFLRGIFSIKKKIFEGKRGYTIIEILVAIGVMAIITGVSIAIYLEVIRIQQEAITIELLQSEGTVILEKMTRVLRDASSVSCPSTPCNGVDTIIINNFEESLEYKTNGNCLTTTFIFTIPDLTAGSEANGKIEKKYSDCEGSAPADEILNNTDIVQGVNVESFSATISAYSEAYPQTIDLSFTLSKGVKALKQASRIRVPFQTRVSTRAY